MIAYCSFRRVIIQRVVIQHLPMNYRQVLSEVDELVLSGVGELVLSEVDELVLYLVGQPNIEPSPSELF
jgi:hypothetical protein